MNDKELKTEEFDQTESEPEAESLPSDLQSAIWAVISFDRIVAGSLTYDQAAAEIKKQIGLKVSGLCIVTDEAASRMVKAHTDTL